MGHVSPSPYSTHISESLTLVSPLCLTFSDPNSGFSKAASSTLGRFVTKPMTRDEACKILNLEEQPELNHQEVLEVSDMQ